MDREPATGKGMGIYAMLLQMYSEMGNRIAQQYAGTGMQSTPENGVQRCG